MTSFMVNCFLYIAKKLLWPKNVHLTSKTLDVSEFRRLELHEVGKNITIPFIHYGIAKYFFQKH